VSTQADPDPEPEVYRADDAEPESAPEPEDVSILDRADPELAPEPEFVVSSRGSVSASSTTSSADPELAPEPLLAPEPESAPEPEDVSVSASTVVPEPAPEPTSISTKENTSSPCGTIVSELTWSSNDVEAAAESTQRVRTRARNMAATV